jgi:hypothetical protein
MQIHFKAKSCGKDGCDIDRIPSEDSVVYPVCYLRRLASRYKVARAPTELMLMLMQLTGIRVNRLTGRMRDTLTRLGRKLKFRECDYVSHGQCLIEDRSFSHCDSQVRKTLSLRGQHHDHDTFLRYRITGAVRSVQLAPPR